MKKYKESTPIDTVNKIRNILHDLGIFLKESHSQNMISKSCRIIIGNDEMDVCNIGTNGKGISLEYSLASGYAEFMERLQNHVLLNKRRYANRNFIEKLPVDSYYVRYLSENNLIFDYVYGEDEEVWDIEDVLKYSKEDLSMLFNMHSVEEMYSFFVDYLNIQKTLMLPFYSVMDKQLKYIPIDLCLSMTNTNGMSAGNSQDEAILQAICEIFERYSMRKIYYEHITPPDIPLEYFRNAPVYDMLRDIVDNLGYKIIVKDCSLGKSIPVVGLLIIDQNRKLYNFKLGADFVLSRALERCLNELQQGTEDFKWNDYKFIDIDYFSNMNIDNIYMHNYCNIFTTGYGYWPSTILSHKGSYDFIPYDTGYGKSNADDLKIASALIENSGFKMYIRNNSLLGFPSYFVVIPGMSNVWNQKNDYTLYTKSFSNINLINRIPEISYEDAAKLATALDENYVYIKYHSYQYTSNYFYNTDFDLLNLDIELLLFMIFFYIKNYEKSYHYMSIFLKDKDKKHFEYYFACLDFVKIRFLTNNKMEDVKHLLVLLYGVNLAEEVIEDLTCNNIFCYYKFPNCFKCECCEVKSTCKLFTVLAIEKRILDKSNKHLTQYMRFLGK